MDPIISTVVSLVEAIVENPVAGPILFGAVRSVTGWIQKKWFGATNQAYDKKILGATILKYTVAINAVAAILPADLKYISSLVILVDIAASFANKLRK